MLKSVFKETELKESAVSAFSNYDCGNTKVVIIYYVFKIYSIIGRQSVKYYDKKFTILHAIYIPFDRMEIT